MGTKDVNIGGTGLANINFASINTQVIFINTIKNFLTSLGQIGRTLDEVEKAQFEKLILQFLNWQLFSANLENVKWIAKETSFKYHC